MLRFRKARLLGQDVVLATPMTYMNESGVAVRKLLRMYGFAPEQLLLIYDDIDLPLGSLRIRERGSAGSHKGMKSVIQHLGSQEFPRLRIGIRPDSGAPGDIVGYVLKPLRGRALNALLQGAAQAADAAEVFLRDGIHSAMNRYNRRRISLLPPAKGEAISSTRRIND